MPATILVVDDDPAIIFILEEALTDEGFQVLTARNGAQAVMVGTTALPDLVVMDLMMPVLDGPSAIRQLKSDPATSHIPIIAISAAPITAHPMEAAAPDLFMAKPFDLDALTESVAMLVTQGPSG